MSYAKLPAYAQGITVAGLLFADRVASLYDRVTQKSSTNDIEYLELILKVNNVQLIDRLGLEANVIGTLHLTTSHVIFKAYDSAKELWIANSLIGSVEKGSLSAVGTPMIIKCKHFLVLTLLIQRDKDCQDLYETLIKFASPVNIMEVFALENRERNGENRSTSRRRGWDRFSWEIEFARQGIGTADSGYWNITDFNKDYQHCDTYPEALCVPSSASKQVLIGSCKFRSRARLPVLTYWHRSNAASISRCAQPLSGFSARCIEDEQLMNLIAKTNPNCQSLCLIDTRPKVNAMMNKMQGKGFEDTRNYSNMHFHFFDIENIHVMRSSLQKFLEGEVPFLNLANSACHRSKTVTDYYKLLDGSCWLRHLKSLLECGAFLADLIVRGVSAVVHCSDGWDRTAQTVSIAQVLLDPFFRTIRGFQILIEKDWLGFGHKFDDRCGHVKAMNEEAAKEVSPVFTQFLDCIYQLIRLNPRMFEYNERFLIEIHEHVYSCQYGTFLGNCDKDRKDLNLAKRTKSLWVHLDDHHDDYINPLYEANKYGYLSEIDLQLSSIVVWTGLYNRFDTNILPKESVSDVTIVTLEHIGVLEAHIAALHAKMAEMKSTHEKHAIVSDMVDSGHSSNGASSGTHNVTPCNSANDRKESLLVTDFADLDLHESGVYDCPTLFPEDVSIWRVLRWQSLRNADECSSKTCGAEFVTRGERRLHCYRCGKIYCRRCVQVSSDHRERICTTCSE